MIGTPVDKGRQASWWPGLNDRGTIVGIAETAAKDTRRESWSCSAFFPSVTHHVCRWFVWRAGVMTPLPTLGGTHGFATGVNDRGQVVGISGICDDAVGKFSARRAVLWEHGRVIDIGNLGGEAWHTPMAINRRGDVVGFSNPPGVVGGDFLPHAFLWTAGGGMQDLDVLPGDDWSQACAINARGQVVGRSCGADGCRAFLWEDGVTSDLNDLVAPGYLDHLERALDINERGQITGGAVESTTGETVAFVATIRRRLP